MIRSFTLRDISLVHRLSEQGFVFHTRSALTQDVRPLREALVQMVVGGQYPTYVWKADEGNSAGFAQLHQGEHQTNAYILCVGSTSGKDEPLSDDIWLPFLDELTHIAGAQGLHNLIAEVDEEGDSIPILRQAGFAVYTRQDIWRIDQRPERANKPIEVVNAEKVDEWDINLLYANTVPRLIQIVEPPPNEHELKSIWVLREEGELSAFVSFTEGTTGTWMRLYVHPNAQSHGDDIVEAALNVMPPQNDRPIYCCVRRYQSWVQGALDKIGFQHIGSQAMLVRQTVQQTRKLVPALSEEMKKKAATARQNWISNEPSPQAEPVNQSISTQPSLPGPARSDL